MTERVGKRKVFFIDGSCNNKKTGKLARVGGVGVIELQEDRVICNAYGPYENVSSDRMEVLGLLHCLRQITSM